MRPTLRLLQSTTTTSTPHKPLIHFLGKRSPPSTSLPPPPFPLPIHTATNPLPPPKSEPSPSPNPPKVHPASPTSSLPDSFASYRSKAQQHGPLAGRQFQSSSPPLNTPTSRQSEFAYGAIGGHTGHELGSVEPEKKGVVFDRNELPERFRRTGWTEAEIEAVGSGGASAWG